MTISLKPFLFSRISIGRRLGPRVWGIREIERFTGSDDIIGLQLNLGRYIIALFD